VGFGYTYNRYKEFMLNIDIKTIKTNQELLKQIHEIRFKKESDEE
jgi:hypothetical protein